MQAGCFIQLRSQTASAGVKKGLDRVAAVPAAAVAPVHQPLPLRPSALQSILPQPLCWLRLRSLVMRCLLVYGTRTSPVPCFECMRWRDTCQLSCTALMAAGKVSLVSFP